MGLLDSVLGQVLGGTQAQPQAGDVGSLGGLGGLLGGNGDLGGLAGALGGLLANNGEVGGLGGLVSKFNQAGMGDVIGSWVGTGENAPISGGQLQQALGGDVISSIAQKLGINASTLLPLLATMLPTLIDQLTPKGHGVFPILVALRQWSEEFDARPEEIATILVDKEKGRPVRKLELYSQDGRLLSAGDIALKPRTAGKQSKRITA